MKKLLMLFIFINVLFISNIYSQEKEISRIPLLGEMAPEFKGKSTLGNIHFPDDYFMKWKILFSHPADFTPVCSTEILELAAMHEEFEKLNAKIIVISTDGLSSHFAWVKSLETIKYPGNETVKIKFPLVSDNDFSISKKYGMLHSYTSNTKDIRGVFIVDPNDRIAAVFFYPMNVGRNMDEIKRTLIALQTAEKHNVLTPANWIPGKDVLESVSTEQGESKNQERTKDQASKNFPWYMIFKKLR